MVLGMATDTLAPTNTLVGNPAALKRTLETGGANLLTGAMHLARRLARQRRPARLGRRLELRGRRQPRLTPGAWCTATTCWS